MFRTIRNRHQFVPDSGTEASVFVVSSGSCDGGPAAWWLPRLLGSADNTVAPAGYCSPGTVGGQLLALAQASPAERRRLTGSLCWPGGATRPLAEIGAGIVALPGYSAHADQAGLLDWVFNVHEGRLRVAGKAVFIQHGGQVQREGLARAIAVRAHEAGISVRTILPDDPGHWFDLDQDARVLADEDCQRQLQDEIARLTRELSRMQGNSGKDTGGGDHYH